MGNYLINYIMGSETSKSNDNVPPSPPTGHGLYCDLSGSDNADIMTIATNFVTDADNTDENAADASVFPTNFIPLATAINSIFGLAADHTVTVADESGNEVDPEIVAKPGKYNISVFDGDQTLLPNKIEIMLSSGEGKGSSQTPLDNELQGNCDVTGDLAQCQIEIVCPDTLLVLGSTITTTTQTTTDAAQKVDCQFSTETPANMTLGTNFVSDGGSFPGDFTLFSAALASVLNSDNGGLSETVAAVVTNSSGAEVQGQESMSGSYTVTMTDEDGTTYVPFTVNLLVAAGDSTQSPLDNDTDLTSCDPTNTACDIELTCAAAAA